MNPTPYETRRMVQAQHLRLSGMTWKEVGRRLGVSRVGAQLIARLDEEPDRCAGVANSVGVNEAALYVGKSRGWLVVRRKKGGGPPWFRVGTIVRYDLAALDDWLEQREGFGYWTGSKEGVPEVDRL